jgi:TolB-like protein
VLPFENLSKDEENAFFASGVQDEILTNLARIADLKVISRTSVMKYGSRAGRNLREIAKALGVAHVVEGSVQRAGGKVRVTAQLIDARSDAHVWADHYDRDLADVFAIQSEIAQQIAGQLRAKLSPEEKAAIDERPTADLKAYALYSEAKAIEVWDYEPQKNLLRKIALLEQATERDPKFALAWCELAKLQTDLGEAHFAAAKKAAETAVQLRPDLGQSHLALAYYYLHIPAERERAYEELSIARRTLPNDALLFRILSHLDARRNRWDDSLAELQKAYALDPLNEEIQYHLSVNYQFMRLYAERAKLEDEWAAKKVDEVDWYYMAYAQIKLDAGDPAAAQSFLAKVPDTFSPTSEIWVTRFNAALYLHDYDAASRVLAAIPAKMAEEMFDGQPPQSSADALLARARGDQQKAQAIYSALREKMTTKWAGPPQRDLDLAKAAELDAGSGRKDQAINEARRAVELRPIAQDSLVGPGRIRTLALVYAWTGESAFAIEQLEIIAKIPAGPQLRRTSLRSDVGFFARRPTL